MGNKAILQKYLDEFEYHKDCQHCRRNNNCFYKEEFETYRSKINEIKGSNLDDVVESEISCKNFESEYATQEDVDKFYQAFEDYINSCGF